MSSSSTADAEPSFTDLLRDIMENPDRVLDESLTPEQVLALQKAMNPYSYVLGGAGGPEQKRAVAASYTNLRADYLQRFTMTSLVGFLFRMLDEWVVPAEARRWTSGKKAKKPKPAWAAAEALEHASAVQALAELARQADADASKATSAAAAADAAASSSKGEDADPADAAAANELLKAADEALAKARGLQYAALTEMARLGEEADARLEACERAARQHPQVREVIDRGGRRQPASVLEAPPAVAKGIIAGFLRAWFEFNPDAHVRSAYDEFVSARDTAPAELAGLGLVPVDRADPARLPLAAARAPPPAPASAEDAAAVAALAASPEARAAAACLLRNEGACAAFARACAAEGGAERLRRYLGPVAAGSPARPAVDVIPPQDTFHRWRYYTEVNFEELRSATEAIYHEKPDLDWALILYEYFEGAPAEVDAAFADFRDKHQDEVISDIKGLDFGGWTLLGDFKENRDKISFYNKHTDVLKRILDRHAEDKKLGQDLMRNRVRQLKAKNIRADGPDAPGLAEYAAQNAGVAGAERVISREEMFRLERAKGDIRAAQELKVLDQSRLTIADLSAAAKVRDLLPEEETRLKNAQKDLVLAQEMVEVPDDAIQVDVWTHDTAKGAFGKSKFYTKAEAPEMLGEPPAARPPPPGAAAPAVAAARARPANIASVADLAPFAQLELAREIAETRLGAAGSSSAAGPPL